MTPSVPPMTSASFSTPSPAALEPSARGAKISRINGRGKNGGRSLATLVWVVAIHLSQRCADGIAKKATHEGLRCRYQCEASNDRAKTEPSIHEARAGVIASRGVAT